MPQLTLTDGAVGSSSLTAHISAFADYLLAKGDDPEYVRKVVANCRKVCLDCGWISPEDITDTRMLEWLAASKQAGRRGAKTRNHYRDAVVGWCRWMTRKGIAELSFMELVPKSKVTDARAKMVPTTEQVDALIEAVKADKRKKDRWIVYMLAAGTGLRHRELQRLKVHMYRPGDNPHFLLPAEITKSKKVQTVFVPMGLDRIIEEHIKGKGLDDSVLQSVPKHASFERDRTAAGIPKVDKSGAVFTFHSLRHYFNMTLANADVDSETRRKLMRHSSLAMTEGVYTKTNATRLSKKVSEMTFFAVDTDPDPPTIEGQQTETPRMNALLEGVGYGGSNPLTPTSPTNTTQSNGADQSDGGVVASIGGACLSEEQASISDNTGETGGGVRNHTLGAVAPITPASTPNDNRPVSPQRPPQGSPRQDGLSPTAAHSQTTPPRFTARDIAEAYSQGLRDGRAEMNGDQA